MSDEELNRIIGYLQNTLSLEEKKKFLDWVNENEANKSLFFELKTIYETRVPYPSFDIQASWERLLSKRILSTRPARLLHPFLRYAAVAVTAVLITTACFLYGGGNRGGKAQTYRFVSGNEQLVNVLYLPDGTIVKLGERTTVSYDAEYGKEKRVVYLDGEAYFEVAKQKERPFIVRAKGQEIEALGTRFNVRAYSKDDLSETTLLEGRVRLSLEGVKGQPVLSPGQQLSYKKGEKTAVIKSQVNTTEVISWMQGYYSFSGESLENILNRIEQIYDVSFAFQSDRLAKRLFTGTFYKGQTISQMMEIINVSIPINYTIEGKNISIREK